LFSEHEANETLKSLGDVSIADIHGQHVFNYRHPHIKEGEETEFLLRAFRRDFEVNGPSVVRIVRTVLRSWKKYKHHANPRIRARFAHEASNLPVRYAGVLWATRRQFRDNPQYVAEINELLGELFGEFGWRSRLAAPIAGRYLYYKLQQQQKMLAAGWTYEPPTFYEVNRAETPGTAKPAESILASRVGGESSAEGSLKTVSDPEALVLS
jgi:hypothetical protein